MVDLHPIIFISLQWDPDFTVHVFPFILLNQVVTIPNRLFQAQHYTDISNIVLNKEMFFLLFSCLRAAFK